MGSPPGPAAETPTPAPDAALADDDDGDAGAAAAAASLVRPADPPRATFLGRDPKAVAAQAISHATPTTCQARTRLYRGGKLEREGFPVADISDWLADPSAVVWLDLHNPDHEDLSVLSAEFGLHPLAVEDAVEYHERTKLDRYHSHLFLLAYGVKLDGQSGELVTSELAAFVTPRALITVRKDDGLDIGMVARLLGQEPRPGRRWGQLPAARRCSTSSSTATSPPSRPSTTVIEELEDLLFDETAARPGRAAAQLRAAQEPGHAAPGGAADARGGQHPDAPRPARRHRARCTPYYQDVYDHVLRATEWTESLRDLVTHDPGDQPDHPGQPAERDHEEGHQLGRDHRRPDRVTGFYGKNVPYPGFARSWGVLAALGIMVVVASALYVAFKRWDWL